MKIRMYTLAMLLAILLMVGASCQPYQPASISTTAATDGSEQTADASEQLCASMPPFGTITKPTNPEAIKDCSLTVTALISGTTVPLSCPPICMEFEGSDESGNDRTGPLTFEVCSESTGCFPLVTGNTAAVTNPACVNAPDGTTPGQQLTHAEKDVGIGFQNWARDGCVLTANYGIVNLERDHEPMIVQGPPKPAQAAGCNSTGGWGLFWGGANWVQVDPGQGNQELDGFVSRSNVSVADFYMSHDSYDHNFWVVLDNDKEWQLLSTRNGQRGEHMDEIVVEWETGSFPRWAWPHPEINNGDYKARDMAWVKGKWIYDCGHQDDSIDQGAWTELHPPIAVASMRGTQAGSIFLREDLGDSAAQLSSNAVGIQGVQIDTWINGDAGPAVKHVSCGAALDFFSNTGCLYDTAFDIRDLYEFDVPLPSPPSHDLLLPGEPFRVVYLRLQPGQPQPEVTAQPNPGGGSIHVKIDLREYDDIWQTCRLQNNLPGENLKNCGGPAYGVTIIAGWELATLPADMRKFKLTVTGVSIFDDMEGEDGDGEFYIDLDIGPSAALAGDVLTSRVMPVALDVLNTDLHHAAGNGEEYPLMRNGQPLEFILLVRKNVNYANSFGLRTSGREDDPFYSDDIGKLERIWEENRTLWKDPLRPSWSGCSDTNWGPPGCLYGYEELWGSRRGLDSAPIKYEDLVKNEDGDIAYSLHYEVEELPK